MKEIYIQKIGFFEEELRRISGFLSAYSDGTTSLWTIAGLLSFLPQLVIQDSGYLTHFLSWTFWILLLSIAIYYPASLRVSYLIKGAFFASSGSDVEEQILKNRVEYLEQVWKKTVENHDSVRVCYMISKSVIFAYIFSLVSNLYIFVYQGKPDLATSLVILTDAILLALILLWLPKMKSQKNKVIGG